MNLICITMLLFYKLIHEILKLTYKIKFNNNTK
jgi:hypothetical protein